MSLTATQMRRLEADSRKMPHQAAQFIAEAMAALRRGPDSPRDALHLLRALHNSSRAATPAQKTACEEVIRWLEGRLQRGTTSDRLRFELGWIKRLIKAR